MTRRFRHRGAVLTAGLPFDDSTDSPVESFSPGASATFSSLTETVASTRSQTLTGLDRLRRLSDPDFFLRGIPSDPPSRRPYQLPRVWGAQPHVDPLKQRRTPVVGVPRFGIKPFTLLQANRRLASYKSFRKLPPLERHTNVCLQRRARREVIFAYDLARRSKRGSGGRRVRRHHDASSAYSCR